MADEPTLGEVIRRLDDTNRNLERLTQQLATFTPREVHDMQIRGLQDQIDDLEEENRRAADFRRQVLLAAAIFILGAIVSISLNVVALLR